MSTSFNSGVPNSQAPISTFLAAQMLYTPTPTLIAGAAALDHVINPAEGTTKMFVEVPNFPLLQAIGTSASQGATPFQPTYNTVAATTTLYNESCIYSVTSRISSQIPLIAVFASRMRVASFRTEDNVLATGLLNNPFSFNCSKGTNGQTPSDMSYMDAVYIRDYLHNAMAPTTAEMRAASKLFNSQGLTPGYILLTSSVGESMFTTQTASSTGFVQPGNQSQPDMRNPGELGYFPCGINVFTSQSWPINPAMVTSGGYQIVQGSVCSVNSYTRIIHPSLFHSGMNLQQT